MSTIKKKIFIFDDDESILDIFTLVLEASGYQVFTSQTSHDIIHKIEQVHPDVIIMDNWIPNIGGIEATRLVKNHPDFMHIPVIYCSANSDIASLANQAGSQAYLSKPFDLNELEEVVAKMFQKIEII